MVFGREHTTAYTGGKTVDVIVRIGASSWNGITAMGLYEKLPEGWTLEALQLLGGVPPSIAPETGTGGVLQFIWIVPPRTPVAMRYTVRVPSRDSGVRTLSGQVEYRLGGGKLTSNVALTQIDGVADELPVLRLLGAAAITVPQYATFEDPGAVATDKEDGDLSNRIQVAGRVDTSKPNTYTLTYGVMDRAGNRAEPVSRSVTVTKATASGGKDEPTPTPRPVTGTPKTEGKLLATAKKDDEGKAQLDNGLPDTDAPNLYEGGPLFSVPLIGGTGTAADTTDKDIDSPSADTRASQPPTDIDSSAHFARSNSRRGAFTHSGDMPASATLAPGGSAHSQHFAFAVVLGTLVLVGAGWWTAARPGRRRKQ